MEELQDAIEDAQYMNAINDDTPKPTREWKWPTPEELKEYTDKLQTTSPKAFEAEGFCKHGCLGFYLVSETKITGFGFVVTQQSIGVESQLKN
jgi:hypothetical protein